MAKLHDAIKKDRRDKLTAGVLLLHDNAPVHKSQISGAAIRKCGFRDINHPSHSPDLALSNYFYSWI